MTAALIDLGCRPWCDASHDDGDMVHTAQGETVYDMHGKELDVSGFVVDGTRGVYVGSYEFPIDQIPALKAAIARAEQQVNSFDHEVRLG